MAVVDYIRHVAATTGRANKSCDGKYVLTAIVSSSAQPEKLSRLFNIAPGLKYFTIAGDFKQGLKYATAAYSSSKNAQYAR